MVSLGYLWESYARNNDPRLLQELHRLARKGERRYQDAFWYAVYQGHLELAVTLLEYDVTVNTANLSCAILEGHMEMVHLLLAHRGDMKDVIVNTDTFARSVLNGQVEMIRLLLAHGADVNRIQPASINRGAHYYPPGPFSTDMTPLMIAVSTGNAEVMQILLDVRALLNTQDKQGQMALAFAWSSGHREVTRLLIEAGIDIKDKEITALLGRPLKQVHPAIIELLQKAGGQ